MVTPDSIKEIISEIQSNTRDAVALLRLVADEYEKAHNNVHDLVSSFLPNYQEATRLIHEPEASMPASLRSMSTVEDFTSAQGKPSNRGMSPLPHYPLDSEEYKYMEKDPNVPVRDNAGNFEIVPGTAGKANPLNISAEVRKVMDKYYKEDKEFMLKDLYKEVRKLIPDASNNAMYYGYSNYLKSQGWEATKLTKHDKVYIVLVPKH